MTRILQPIVLPPGFAKLSTSLLQEGRWIDGDKVRSVGRVIETIGGWIKKVNSPQVLGLCRGIKTWRSLDDIKNIGLGTHRRLYTFISGTLANITPVRSSGTLGTDPFTTVSGSPVVQVSHTTHGAEVDAFVTYTGATSVGGLDMNAEFEVSAVIDADTYEVTHGSNASSSATGGGTVATFSYEINPGLADTIDTFGYGVGAYGTGFYGTPRTGGSSILLRARTWDIDVSGEDMLALHRKGSIYLYDYSAGGVAALLANAPVNNKGMFVTDQRHVVAIGSGGDPMKVAWSDADDITIWAAAAANQAGDLTLRGGSELISGRKLRSGMNVLWSDTSCFRMVFLGREPFYAIRSEGSGVGLFGPHAHMEMDGIATWMSGGNFYSYDGFIRELPNQDDIKDYVFGTGNEAVDPKQKDKVFAFRSTLFREIWWLYQSIGSTTGEVDRYVMFNIDEARWYTGTMTRTAWEEAVIFNYPVAVDGSGFLYDHENGVDDDGAAMSKTIKSSTFDLADGDRNMEIMGFWPDFDGLVGDLTLTLFTKDHPQEAERTEGPYTITTASNLVDTRADGRQVAMQLESNEIGGKFRMGKNRLEIEPSGNRR